MNNVWTVACRSSGFGLRAFQRPHTFLWACRAVATTQSSNLLDRTALSWCFHGASYSDKHPNFGSNTDPQAPLNRFRKPLQGSDVIPATSRRRTFASVTSKEPQKYRHPFEKLSGRAIATILGPTVNEKLGKEILRILQTHRLQGTLDCISISGVHESIVATALAWLRANYPVDEDAAILARLEREEEQEAKEKEDERIARLVKYGIYKPQAIEQEKDDQRVARSEKSGIYKPQDPRNVGPYSESILEKIRKENEKTWEEEEKRKESESPKSVTPRTSTGVKLVPRRTESAEWVKKYKEKATSKHIVPPVMSKWQRLWPSACVALSIIGASVLFAQAYLPPSRSARLLPDMPPAAATVISLITLNAFVFVLWRVPPLWRFMNKYFILVPALPVAQSILGNTFSHQQFWHFLSNMVILWLAGTRLHDDVGRANFLAIYLSCGVTASFFSLSRYVLYNNLTISSLGASGCVAGVLAAWLMLHSDERLSIRLLPAEWSPSITSSTFLIFILAFELFGAFRRSRTIDHWSHLGGYTAGLTSAVVLNSRREQRKQAEMQRRKNLSFADRIREGRL